MSIKTVCPICTSTDTHCIVVFGNSSISRCNSCTNSWTIPFPQEIIYNEMDFHQQVIESANSETRQNNLMDLPSEWRKVIRKQVKLIKHYLPHGGSLLEIGCGEGFLLKELQKEGFKVKGLEPSEMGSKRARDKGLDVVTGYFPSSLISEKFDAVIMVQVLEHLSNPLSVIKAINQRIPAGYLFLVQTNYRGLVPRLRPKNWYAWLPDQHFWHFTPKGLSIICQKAGFELLKVTHSHLVHNSLFHKLLKLMPFSGDQFHLVLKSKFTES